MTELKDFIFIVSYPRSGNTWVRFLLSGVQIPDESPTQFKLNKAIPDLHQSWMHEVLEREYKFSPIFAKSHHRACGAYEKVGKVIYVYRDVRDVAISVYRYNHRLYSTISISDFIAKFFIPGKALFGSWKDHIEYWLIDKKCRVPVLPVKYEDLYNNTEEQLRKMCDFSELEYSDRSIKAAIGNTAYEKIRSMGASEGYAPTNIGLNGKPGGWRKILSKADSILLLEHHRSILKELNYDI